MYMIFSHDSKYQVMVRVVVPLLVPQCMTIYALLSDMNGDVISVAPFVSNLLVVSRRILLLTAQNVYQLSASFLLLLSVSFLQACMVYAT